MPDDLLTSAHPRHPALRRSRPAAAVAARPQLLAHRARDRLAFLVDGAGIFRRGARRARQGAQVVFHSGLGHRQPHAADPAWSAGRLSRAAWAIFSMRSSRAGTALRGYVLTWDYAMLYALEREWLPDLPVRLEDASEAVVPARRLPSRRRIASPETRRDRRRGRVRQRLRPRRQPLGHRRARVAATRCASMRPAPVRAVPRRGSDRFRSLRRGTRRAVPGTMAAGDGPRCADSERAAAGRRGRMAEPGRTGLDGCGRRHRAHRARLRRARRGQRAAPSASGCDRRRAPLDICREPVFHVAHRRRRAGAATGRARRSRNRAADAGRAKRLAGDVDDGRAPRAHSSSIARHR